MKRIDVGLLLSDSVDFCLNGTFQGGGSDEFTGEHKVSACGDIVEWKGKSYERLIFSPMDDTCTFTVYNVIIGIDFHWERHENQTFRGELHFFAENGKVRVVNRVGVEEYLQSVI